MFFLPRQVKPSLSTQPQEPKDFPNRSLHTDLTSLYITALHFHFFLCWFEDFFPRKLFGSTFYFCEWIPSARYTTCAFFEEATLYRFR